MHANKHHNHLKAPFLASVTLAAAALMGFAAGGPNALPSTTQRPAIAVEGAEMRQGVESVEFAVRASERLSPSPSQAIASGRICVSSDIKTERRELRRLCVTYGRGAWRLTTPSRDRFGVKVRVRDSVARFIINRVHGGVSPGTISWHVDTSSSRCEAAPSGATGAIEPKSTADCPARFPVAGSLRDRIKRVETTGCVVRRSGTVTHGSRRSKRIAIGFDDGPSQYTSALLEKLKKHDAKATFFMLGNQVSARAKLVRRMLAEGHEPANHSWNHAILSGGGGAAASQLSKTNAAIRRASRFTPCTFRPPYGATSGALAATARAQGLATVNWSVDPQDWRGVGADAIVERVVSNAHPGAIVVMHDGGGNRSATVAAVPRIVERLKARGYRFVSVAEILGARYQRRLAR